MQRDLNLCAYKPMKFWKWRRSSQVLNETIKRGAENPCIQAKKSFLTGRTMSNGEPPLASPPSRPDNGVFHSSEHHIGRRQLQCSPRDDWPSTRSQDETSQKQWMDARQWKCHRYDWRTSANGPVGTGLQNWPWRPGRLRLQKTQGAQSGDL